MICLLLLLSQNLTDPELISLGEEIFAQSCSVGYCHGAAGTAGRGPRLKGHSFQAEYVYRVTRDGIPDSAMPGWANRLSDREIWAVVGYVLSLSDSTETTSSLDMPPGVGPAAFSPFSGPPQARAGQDLFFDATKGTTRCSTCHAMGGRGIAIGPNLEKSSESDLSIPRIRSTGSHHVLTARLQDGESFPALRFGQTDDQARLYDLTLPPPVLRTFGRGEIQSLRSASDWSHDSVVKSYTDRELEKIIHYFIWLRSLRQ